MEELLLLTLLLLLLKNNTFFCCQKHFSLTKILPARSRTWFVIAAYRSVLGPAHGSGDSVHQWIAHVLEHHPDEHTVFFAPQIWNTEVGTGETHVYHHINSQWFCVTSGS